MIPGGIREARRIDEKRAKGKREGRKVSKVMPTAGGGGAARDRKSDESDDLFEKAQASCRPRRLFTRRRGARGEEARVRAAAPRRREKTRRGSFIALLCDLRANKFLKRARRNAGERGNEGRGRWQRAVEMEHSMNTTVWQANGPRRAAIR